VRAAILLGAAGCSFTPGHAPDGRVADAPSAYTSAILADTPLAYWPLDDHGDAIADVMGFAPGTASGDCMFGVPGGIATGTAIRFTKTCVIDVGDHFLFTGTTAFTIEAWAQVDQTSNMFRHVFTHETRGNTGPIDGYALLFRDVGHAFVERPVNGQNVVTPDAMADPSFHYLVATFDGANLSIYVDVALVETTPTTKIATATHVHAFIGAASAQGNQFAGTIDEVAIYGRALGPDRLAAHYAARQ
jgi:hypothetical protein